MLFNSMMVNMSASTAKTYATWNPLDKGADIILSNGNLTAEVAGVAQESVRSTIGKSSGKWYWEHIKVTGTPLAAIAKSTASLNAYPGGDANGWMYYSINGKKYNNATAINYGAGYTTEIIGVALNMDAGTVTFYKSNVSQGVAYSGLTGTIYAADGPPGAVFKSTTNFGATAFTYTPPAGYNAGLYN